MHRRTRSRARESLPEQRATSAFKQSLILECEGLLVGINWIQVSVFLSVCVCVCVLASAKQGTKPSRLQYFPIKTTHYFKLHLLLSPFLLPPGLAVIPEVRWCRRIRYSPVTGRLPLVRSGVWPCPRDLAKNNQAGRSTHQCPGQEPSSGQLWRDNI